MRLIWLFVIASSASARGTTPRAPTQAPARDLAAAKQTAPHADAKDAAARDPRVVDLDIIRITPGDGGGDVATADLFREANDAAHSGATERALAIYRKLVADFPESKYAPTALFDMAAIYDGRGDVTATIT